MLAAARGRPHTDRVSSPAGFAPHPSGLIVPAAVAKRREVWTRDEWKTIDRAAGHLAAHRVTLGMRCVAEDCPAPRMAPELAPSGDLMLICGCTERVLTRAH